MRRILVVLFVTAAFLGVILPVSAAEPGRITVTGEAEILAPPDEVVITLGVETWNNQLGIAKRENDERVQAVVDLATRMGIESRHIQTDFVRIEPRWDQEYEHRNFLGYFVQKTVVVTLKDITRFEELLSGALEGQANYVHGIDFRTTELRKHRDRARALAIQAAREKADALAGELGSKVGRPLDIQEDHLGWWSSYGSGWGSRIGTMTQNVIQDAGSSPSMGEGIAPGQISVQARVSVTFELQ